MAKVVLMLLVFVAITASVRGQRVCDGEEIAKFKREMFEKLTSLAETVLEFTKSDEAEKQQVQNVLDELALRRKLDAIKLFKLSKEAGDDANTGMNDFMASDEEEERVYENSPPRENVETPVTDHVPTLADDTTLVTDDVTTQVNDVITTDVPVKSEATPLQTTSTTHAPPTTTTKQCRNFGEECSPRHLEFCCDEFECVRKTKVSLKGRCRYTFRK